MPIMRPRANARLAIVPLTLALLVAGSAGSSSGAGSAAALARAYAIRVVVPVQRDSTGNPFETASAEVTSLSLFNGEVTASDVVAHAKASAKPGAATGDLSGVGVSGLTVEGVPAGAGRVPLGDWGYADVAVQSSAPTATTFHGFVTALDVHLTADHGGLPAGSEIQVGYAEASVQAPSKPKPPPAPPPTPPGKPKPASAGHAKKPKAKTGLKAPEPEKPTPG